MGGNWTVEKGCLDEWGCKVSHHEIWIWKGLIKGNKRKGVYKRFV